MFRLLLRLVSNILFVLFLQGNDGLGGLQISVSLQHMVSCQDKIFVVLFGGKKIILPNGNLSVSWSEVSRTELVVVDDHAEYGGSYVENYFYRFSKLQYPIDSSYYDSCTVVMVAVYKVEYSSSVYTSETVSTSIKTILDTDGNGKKSFGAPTLQHHMALCRCILFKDSFRSYRLFSANMDLLIDIPIDISAALLAPPNARLGVCTMHSSQLALKRSIPMLLGSHKPYAETLYCFPSDLGSVMAFEQLTVSKYGVTVASAMLSFLYQERSQLLDNEMEVLKIALHDAFETLESINGDPHAAGVMEFKAHQYELLRNAYNDMLIMQNNFVDDFVGPYYYLQSNCLANNGKGEASVIEPAVGGNYLRRSAWKKNHPWQYCTTNLHFQLFSSQQFGYLDILKQNQSNNYNLVEQENAKPSTNRGAFGNATESFLPTITLGCPCAHSMKFHEGGLLKILTEPGSGYVSANTAAPISGAKPSYSKAHNSVTYNAASRLEWMRLIQSWKSIDGLMQHIKQQRRENCGHVANYLCGGTGDPLTSKETSVQMWLHRTILSKRIDICSSQALGCAVSVVKALCSFADTVGGVYIDILVRSIRAGFLIGFQSFLSTQGAELGMLEDLDCAALWLNLVTVRLVVNSGEVPKENVDKYHSTRARGIGHLLHNSNFDSNGVNIARGRCEEICVRRGVVSLCAMV